MKEENKCLHTCTKTFQLIWVIMYYISVILCNFSNLGLPETLIKYNYKNWPDLSCNYIRWNTLMYMIKICFSLPVDITTGSVGQNTTHTKKRFSIYHSTAYLAQHFCGAQRHDRWAAKMYGRQDEWTRWTGDLFFYPWSMAMLSFIDNRFWLTSEY